MWWKCPRYLVKNDLRYVLFKSLKNIFYNILFLFCLVTGLKPQKTSVTCSCEVSIVEYVALFHFLDNSHNCWFWEWLEKLALGVKKTTLKINFMRKILTLNKSVSDTHRVMIDMSLRNDVRWIMNMLFLKFFALLSRWHIVSLMLQSKGLIPELKLNPFSHRQFTFHHERERERREGERWWKCNDRFLCMLNSCIMNFG